MAALLLASSYPLFVGPVHKVLEVCRTVCKGADALVELLHPILVSSHLPQLFFVILVASSLGGVKACILIIASALFTF